MTNEGKWVKNEVENWHQKQHTKQQQQQTAYY